MASCIGGTGFSIGSLQQLDHLVDVLVGAGMAANPAAFTGGGVGALCERCAVFVQTHCIGDAASGSALNREADALELLKAARALGAVESTGDVAIHLKVVAARCALLATRDSDSAPLLLAEPWLSFLASCLTEETNPVEGVAQSEPLKVACVLASLAALVAAAAVVQDAGEQNNRGFARIHQELAMPARLAALLMNAEGTKANGLNGDMTACEACDAARHHVSGCCLVLLDYILQDLEACEVLIRQGALPVALRAAREEAAESQQGGQAATLTNAVFTIASAMNFNRLLAALSASQAFAPALAALPQVQISAFVELAAGEVQRLCISDANGSGSSKGSRSSISWRRGSFSGAPPAALSALFHACMAPPAPPLHERLRSSGATSVLVPVIQSSWLPVGLRLESAGALCRLILCDDGQRNDSGSAVSTDGAEAVGAHRISAPPVVAALIALAGAPANSSAQLLVAARGGDGAMLAAARNSLRYQLPWLLACAARGADSTDLSAWTDERIGLRGFLAEALGTGKPRDVCTWALDLVAALCGRLPLDLLLAFLRRGPHPLLEKWPLLLASDTASIQARATVVCYHLVSCLSPGVAERDKVLCMLPLRGVAGGQGPWKASTPGAPRGSGVIGTGNLMVCSAKSISAGQRQLAEVAAAAAAAVATEHPVSQLLLLSAASPDGIDTREADWQLLVALCRLVALGLDALGVLRGCRSAQLAGCSWESVAASSLAWLQHALEAVGRALASPQSSTRNTSAGDARQASATDVHVESVSLLADLLDGPLDVELSESQGGSLVTTQPEELAEKELLSDAAISTDTTTVAATSPRAAATALLEAALLPRGLGAGSQRPLASLLRVAKSRGVVEYGRVLTRLFLSVFSLTPKEQSEREHLGWVPTPVDWAELDEVDALASPDSLQPLSGSTIGSNNSSQTAPCLRGGYAKECKQRQMRFIRGQVGTAATTSQDTLSFVSAESLRTWVGNLLVTRGSGHGLCAVLRFLDGDSHNRGIEAVAWKNAQAVLAAAVMRRFATAREALAKAGLDVRRNQRVVDGFLHLAAQLLASVQQPIILAPEATAAAELEQHHLQVQCAAVELLVRSPPASALGWSSSVLVEVSAYLWGTLHFAAVHPLYDADVTRKSTTAFSGSGRCACQGLVSLRGVLQHSACDALCKLLSDFDIVNVLCQSDDNASVLEPIRKALGDVAGPFPLFGKASAISAASAANSGSDCSARPPWHGTALNIHEQSWCPTGRILFASVVRLSELPRPLAMLWQRLAVVTTAAAARIALLVACPRSLLHSSNDVLALLAACSAIIAAEPPAAETDAAQESCNAGNGQNSVKETQLQWCWQAGSLLITLLHRPPMEVLLAPMKPLQALISVPHGLRALCWCATPEAETGLGVWGARARRMLTELEEAAENKDVEEEHDEASGQEGSLTTADQMTMPATASNHQNGGPATAPGNAGDVSATLAVPAPGTTQSSEQDRTVTAEQSFALTAADLQFKSCDVAMSVGEATKATEVPISIATGASATVAAPMIAATIPAAVAAAAVDAAEFATGNLVQSQLRSEVLSLEEELGSLEAELEAEQQEAMEDGMFGCSTGSEGTCEVHNTALGTEDEQDVEAEFVFVSIGDGRGQGVAVQTGQTGHDEPYSFQDLPKSAQLFLEQLLPERSGLAKVRDGVMALLDVACRHGESLAHFQSAALLEVYREPCCEVPSTRDVRLAMQFLYENAPRKSSAAVQPQSSDEEEPEPQDEDTTDGKDTVTTIAAAPPASDEGETASGIAPSIQLMEMD